MNGIHVFNAVKLRFKKVANGSISKKWSTFLIAILFLTSITTACQESSQTKDWDQIRENLGEKSIENQDKGNVREVPLSKEWIMAYYQLKEKDIQGYDIEQMIKHGYLLNQEKTISRYPSKEDFLSSLPWLQEAAYEKEHEEELHKANNFTYLLKGDSTPPSTYTSIKYIAVESTWDNRRPNETDPIGKVSLLIDFEKKKIYYKGSERSVLEDLREANQVVDLSKEDLDSIIDQLKLADFIHWPHFQSDTEIYNNWKYGIETRDGLIFTNMVENLPENIIAKKVFHKLFSRFVPYPVLYK